VTVTATGDEFVGIVVAPERLDLEFGEASRLEVRGRRASGSEEADRPGPGAWLHLTATATWPRSIPRET
jgi:hypothetical protein